MKGILIAISGMIVLMSGTVHGQSAIPVFDQQEMNQEHWAERSFDRGQLNRLEAAQLDREQDRIARMEKKAKADGVVRKKKGARIGAAQNRAPQHILRERHDRQGARHR